MQLALNSGGFMAKNCAKKEYPKSDFTLKIGPDNFQRIVKKDSGDIYPLIVGKSKLPLGEQTKISSAPHSVLLLFSYEGGGSFQLKETWHRVREHEFFVLPMGTTALLSADANTSWTYRWIGFTGTLTNDFMAFPTVFSLPEEFTATLYDPTEEERNLFSRLAGDLFHVHAKMQEPEQEELDYVQRVINRVNTSYMEKLTITNIATELGLDRSHLSRLFKSRMGITIQDYILYFRTSKAKQYLLNGYSVSDTAALCGFGDYISFSRAFLREAGCRPTEWLKYLKKDSYNRPR